MAESRPKRSVSVEPYSPHYAEEYKRVSKLLKEIFGELLIEVHHIGSTAIPGIYAKPVLDLLPVVWDIEEVDAYNEIMLSFDYEAFGEFGLPGRRYFNHRSGTIHDEHIHIYQVGSPEIERHVFFRDFMIAHPQHAQAYSQLKYDLARQFADDRDAYIDGKDAFVKEMETRALQWAKETNRKVGD